MRIVHVCTILAVACFLPGCLSINVGTDCEGSSGVKVGGLVSGVVDLNGIAPYDGTLIRLGILTNTPRKGELIGLDIWPIAGIGIGFVGARVQLLPLQIGIGALCYEPEAALNKPSPCEPEEPPPPPPPPAPPAPPAPAA